MLDQSRHIFRSVESLIQKIFVPLPLSANQYTYLSLILAIISAYFLATKNFILSLFVFCLAAFCDFIDGAVARGKGTAGAYGAYLDTIIDRYVEGIMLLALMFVPLPSILLVRSEIWIGACIFGSIVTTYAKAAASEKDIMAESLTGGYMSRGERIILLCVGILLANFDLKWCSNMVAVLAIMSNYTALQRITSAFCKSKTILSA